MSQRKMGARAFMSSPPEGGNSGSGGNPVKLEPIAVDSDRDWYQSDGERPGTEWLAHDK